MTKLVAISKQTHTQKMWRRPADYRFAARDPLTPVVLVEIGFVGSWMPIAFVEQAGCFVPMAMMSPVPEHNLFVGPDGKWLGRIHSGVSEELSFPAAQIGGFRTDDAVR